MHVFGPRAAYPLEANRHYTPGPATPDDLRRTMAAMGMENAVLVQPSPYGDDHSCLIDALEAMEGHAVGVACFGAEHRSPDGLLDRLSSAGVRGLRVVTLRSDPAEARVQVERAAALAAETGWHLELQITRAQIAALPSWLEGVSRPSILDHMARAEPEDVPRLASLPRVRVKLSGLYRHKDRGSAVALAHAFLAQMPDRCLWGSDWPHTPPHPIDRQDAIRPQPFRSVDVAADYDAIFAPVPAPVRRQVLCLTPADLYARAGADLGETAP